MSTHRLVDRIPRRSDERYADANTDTDMHPETNAWEYSKRQRQYEYDASWVLPEAPVAPFPYAFSEQALAASATAVTDGLGQLQLSPIAHQTHGRLPKTRTNPVVTRSHVTRHGSQPPVVPRPSSSGAETVMLPYRQNAPPRRAGSYSHPTPLEDFRRSRRWPPNGFRSDDDLTPEEADGLICAGASTFRGYCDQIPKAPPGYDRFYAVMDNEHQTRTDRAAFSQPAFRDVSLNMAGTVDSQCFPWLCLEQPSMAYAYGKSAGTTTLNFWVSKSGSSPPPTKVAGDVRPRKIKFLQILDRLQQLENGLEEDVSLGPVLVPSWVHLEQWP